MKTGGRRFQHLAPAGVLVAIIVAVGITVGSSVLFYKVGGTYHRVYNLDDPSDPLIVYLRIDNINPQPQKFAVALASVKIYNSYDDDIHLKEFRAEAYNGPKGGATTWDFGQDSAKDIYIPAKTVKVVKMNVKIYNYELFKETDMVWVYYYINWIHGPNEHVKLGLAKLDISGFHAIFNLP